MRLALLSNVTMALLATAIAHDVYVPAGYNTWQLEILDKTSALNTEVFNAVFVLLHCKDTKKNWQTPADGMQTLDDWLGLLSSAAGNSPETHFFISNLDIEVDTIRPAAAAQPERIWEHHWQTGITRLCHAHPNVFLFDLKSMVERMGRNTFYSPKLWYAAGTPYSSKAIKALADEITRLAAPQRKKVLALDLDNTLWGGVIGEDSIELSTHKEGARYHDFQLRLKELSQTGTLLAITSKNNAEDAMRVLEEHPAMALRPEDFAGIRINWSDKPENLRELAAELNLSTDAIVFVDDNPMERALMRQELPEVTTVEFPADTTQLERLAHELYREHFRVLRATAEDTRRTQNYHAERERRQLRSAAATPTDYLRALEMDVLLHKLTSAEVDRVVQLCGKTNQFNLTTRRYDKHALTTSMRADSGRRALTIHCRDKYGDSGLVGLILINEQCETPVIDAFLLSCRVMGRLIEEHVISAVTEYYSARGFARIGAVFIPTAKNKPVARLYDRLGFEVTAQSPQRTEYSYDLSKPIARASIYKSFTAEVDGDDGYE